MGNHYEVLGVPESASLQEIKNAYRKLAVLHHPDKNPSDANAADTFKRINLAYQVLSDTYQRSVYDINRYYQQNQPEYTYSNSSGTDTSQEEANYEDQADDDQSAEENRRDNLITLITLVVFGSFVGVVVYFMGIGGERSYEDMLEAKKEMLGDAITYFEGKNYPMAIQLTRQVMVQNPLSSIPKNYFKEIMGELDRQSTIYLADSNYSAALEILKLQEKYDTSIVKQRLFQFSYARCFWRMGKPDEAMVIIDRMLVDNPNDIGAMMEAAEILELGKNDVLHAKLYYERAVLSAVRSYVDKYGEAYPMLVQPSDTPDSHVELFLAKAAFYARNSQFQKAVDDCSWAAFLRPFEHEILVQKANYLKSWGKKKLACKTLDEAIAKGSTVALDLKAKNCK